MKTTLLAVLGGAVATLATAPPAQADAQSFQSYLESHHTNTGLNPPASNLAAGLKVCDMLHAGETPDQVAAVPVYYDFRGLIEAAQHELCPDTLR